MARQKDLDDAKVEVVRRAEVAFPDAARYEPQLDHNVMGVNVFEASGHGRFQDLGVTVDTNTPARKARKRK